jgi:ketosteroid isomerase-like protein
MSEPAEYSAAMSENVELVRRTFEAVCRGDLHDAASGFHEQAAWHNTADFPGPRTWVGPRAIIDFWKSLMENFEQPEGGTEVERAVESDEAVVLAVRSVGRGKASSVPIDVRWGAAFHVRGGRITRVDVHGDWAKALRSAGLAG